MKRATTARTHICVCMGSSCFARGNRENLAAVREFLTRHRIEAQVDLVGSLCMNNCRRGPTVIVNGERHDHVDAEACAQLLEGLR